ncbi:hypothetical protein [Algoriphagus persicinus]|uniref:hypothetical protein n=1 Tax=Algoriphagus persicinus TaxID=3108754 RepID=UPI002B37771C|nr:hypothetical protein [Algoriphagus sp. E1-3-M2]MEB2786386.1 hypothetical protein [Algoriphagus sp. E1-3-M2]
MKNLRIILTSISFLAILISLFLITSFKSASPESSSDYSIAEFYEAIDVDSDVKVLTRNGDLEEIEYILEPTTMKTGVFEVKVTREADDLYQIVGTDYFIETLYCYEYASYESVILKVESQYGYTKGKLIFE